MVKMGSNRIKLMIIINLYSKKLLLGIHFRDELHFLVEREWFSCLWWSLNGLIWVQLIFLLDFIFSESSKGTGKVQRIEREGLVRDEFFLPIQL